MKNEREAFNYYISYYEFIEDLNDKQVASFTRALLGVQFFKIHINEVAFKDKLLTIIWKTIRYSIKKQVDGYCSKHKLDYNVLFKGFAYPTDGGLDPRALQEQGQEEEQEQGQEEEQKKEKEQQPFSFSLKNATQYSNLSKEYKTKLKAKCLLIDGNFTRYEDFIMALEAKGYSYKDFSKVYMSWDKEKAYKSFKPILEPSLGVCWFRVHLANNEILAINSETLEMKSGVAETKKAVSTPVPINRTIPKTLLKVKGF